MNNEPNKLVEAQELTEKELECVTGGVDILFGVSVVDYKFMPAIDFDTMVMQ